MGWSVGGDHPGNKHTSVLLGYDLVAYFGSFIPETFLLPPRQSNVALCSFRSSKFHRSGPQRVLLTEPIGEEDCVGWPKETQGFNNHFQTRISGIVSSRFASLKLDPRNTASLLSCGPVRHCAFMLPFWLLPSLRTCGAWKSLSLHPLRSP